MKRREFLKSLGVFIAAPSLALSSDVTTEFERQFLWELRNFPNDLENADLVSFASEEESKKALSVLAWNFKNTGWRRIN